MTNKIKLSLISLGVLFIVLQSCSKGNDLLSPPKTKVPTSDFAVLTKIEVGTDLPLESIHFVNSNIGFLVASKFENNTTSSSRIYKTIDGGNNWTEVYTTESLFIESIKAKDENLVIAVSNVGKILRSLDGGKTWSENDTYFNNMYYMKDVAMHTQNDEVYIVGHRNNMDRGFVLKSTDNGKEIGRASCRERVYAPV